MKRKQKKYITPAEKELKSVKRQEAKLYTLKQKENNLLISGKISDKIPEKIYFGLESAFCKAFVTVFKQSHKIIERTYSRENIIAEYSVRNYAVDIKGSRKEIRKLHKNSDKNNILNTSISGIEGLALGVLGIGIPDIVIFLSILLRGVYQTALNYGFDYSSRHEQLLILKIMEASLRKGENWPELNEYVDELFLDNDREVSDAEFDLALRACASAFAADMLLMKFVQGLPIVGILGGAANPIFYNKVMKYVKLKYKKHYLIKKLPCA